MMHEGGQAAKLVFATNFWYAHAMPAKNTSFSVGEHLAAFIEEQVAQGRYASASDVVRAGLRLLEEREAHLAALRAALIEGEESGVSDKNLLDIWAEFEEKERQKETHG
jgi:antitoxin ParD1/3/4